MIGSFFGKKGEETSLFFPKKMTDVFPEEAVKGSVQ
jgi:hypothetical protein